MRAACRRRAVTEVHMLGRHVGIGISHEAPDILRHDPCTGRRIVEAFVKVSRAVETQQPNTIELGGPGRIALDDVHDVPPHPRMMPQGQRHMSVEEPPDILVVRDVGTPSTEEDQLHHGCVPYRCPRLAIASPGSMPSQQAAATRYKAATLNNGTSQRPQAARLWPKMTGLSAPPRFPNVFIVPLTTPAWRPPISRHTAHAGLTPRAASPAAAASNPAARPGESVNTAPATASAARGKPTRPGARRPARTPHRCASTSLSHPPSDTPPAMLTSGNAASQPACCGSKPRARCRYVGSQVM